MSNNPLDRKWGADPDAIYIAVEGGVIQDIVGIPKGKRIVVFDYDTDKTEGTVILPDGDGGEVTEYAFVGVWEHEE